MCAEQEFNFIISDENMKKLNMKIHRYDIDQKIIIASFSTDLSLKPVDDYQPVGFDIRQYSAENTADLLKQIAFQGIKIALQNDLREQQGEPQIEQTELESLQGQVFSFLPEELEVPNNVNIIIS